LPYRANIKDLGYTDCGCSQDFEPGVVLDPFCGSGTTLAVAKRLGRKAIGIDINENYCKLAVKRLQEIPLSMELG
jgi:DNA modification methylase